MFGAVVTDGRGTFHSVVREDGANQLAVYRRSVDGGETWTIRGLFRGDGGGATRPSIAVDGDRVAVTFIGLWCPTSLSFCEEVPYLVTSTDAGLNWGQPLRLDTQAFSVRVAVDDDRVWVAWQRQTTVELRGTSDSGRSMFARETYAGWGASLDAADEMMVMAFRAYAPNTGTDYVLGTVTAKLRLVGPLRTVRRPRFENPSVATADGSSHVLLVDLPPDPVANPAQVSVLSAAGVAPFGAPVVVMPAGQSATIDAAVGTVAVAVSDRMGTTWVSTSSDQGSGFSAAIAVSSSGGATPLSESEVHLSIATPPQGRPLARFDWSVPDRYIDTDGDHLPEPANGSGNDAVDQLRVYANQAMTVTLDACNKSKPSAGRTITNFTWMVDGNLHDSGPLLCKTTITVDDGSTAKVQLTVDDDVGTTSSVEQDVAPHDHLIVSIGDSIASGEGSPHAGGSVTATWQNGSCHRSSRAGPALAAQRLETADQRSSVTFVQLACSGAAIVDVPEVALADDPATGGLIDSYGGIVQFPGSLRPSQLQQMTTLVGNRPVDALLVSIGANDVKFSEVLKNCLNPVTLSSCDQSSTRTVFEGRLAGLPGRYARLATAIAGLNISANRVRLTEYFDPTSDDLGVTEMRCAVLPDGQPGLIDDDEAIWARDGVISALNATGRAAAASAGWRYVGGIARQFFRHGYCATDHWVVQLVESIREQDDENGAFHPNPTGQKVYGSALFADLQASLVIPAPTNSPGAAVGPNALGDMMVLTTTYETLTSAAVDITGGAPLARGVRRLDRLALGDGLLFPAGPPAVDATAAVGIWTELSGVGAFDMQTLAAQIAVRPNAAVRKVRIVQAPADASLLVAGRDTLVQATIDAMISGPEALDVTTTVTADSGGISRELVPATTERINFTQGRNVVLLPVGSAFSAREGEIVNAIVEVSDPIGAATSDNIDNLGNTAVAISPSAITTRPLDVMVGRAGLGGSTVSCQTIKSVAERMAAFASVAMPVDAEGVHADLFCGLQPPITQDEPGLLAGLAILDEMARYSGVDAMVLVVPGGWLSTAAAGAVGVAVPGLRGVILEATAPPETMSHELAHIYGVEHTKTLVPAFGARVDTRLNRAGTDWMAETVQNPTWTGGANWDQLATTIGGPAHAPEPLDANGSGVWVRGTVSRTAQGWGVSSGRWIAAGSGSATDPVAPTSLNFSRMTVDQVDGNGDVVASTPVGLGAAGGLYGAGVMPPSEPFGFGFSTRVELDSRAVSLLLTLDGAVVETMPLSGAPTVVLSNPVAGSRFPRGSPLTVQWTASDPDGDPLTASVFISGDDGVTWHPLATGVTTETITEPVPQDIGGAAVRVRVVVSDGLRFAEAVSGAFSAEPDVSLGDERIVFIRDLTSTTLSRRRVMTMRPDGTDVVELALPLEIDSQGPVNYRDPAWGPDDRIYFSANLLATEFDGADPSQWEGGFRIWSSKPDGSDLQRITPPASDTSFWPTNAFGQSAGSNDDRCPTLSPDGNKLAWLGGDTVWTADRTVTGWASPSALVTSGSQPLLTMHPSFPTTTVVPNLGIVPNGGEFSLDSCPRWSPDSKSMALLGPVRYGDSAPTPRITFDYSAVVVIAIDGSSMRVVSPRPNYIPGTGGYTGFLWQTDFYDSIDWSGDTLLVSRGFENLATFNPGGGLGSSPNLWTVFRLDPADGTLTRLMPQPDVYVTIRPNKFKVSPAGIPYGTLYRPPDGQCAYGGSDMVLFQLGSGAVDQVPADRPVGTCTVNDRSFDWVIRSTGGGPGTSPPLLTVDPAAAPDDGNAPVDIDITTVTGPSDQPAPGADDIAPIPLPVAAPLNGVVVPADTPTTLTLPTVGGALAPIQIEQLPPPSQMTIATAGPNALAVVTGLDGEVIVTPAPGFQGTTSFTYFVEGDPTHVATATVTVVGNAAPVAADDDLAVPVGSETTFDPAALLANDVDPDAAARAGPSQRRDVVPMSLTLVSVFASGNGRAWLDGAGIVHVLAQQPGAYDFSYIVADNAGATDTATARVIATAEAVEPTTTSSTTTSPTTTSPTTTSSATNPTPVQPTPSAEPPADSPGTNVLLPPGGALPQTGGTLTVAWWALTLVIFGSVAICLRRAKVGGRRRL